MAISFVNQIASNKFLPASNPIQVTVNSNNNGLCNFRYVCDVYINNSNVFRFKLFPDPSTGYGFFQVNDVINDYLTAYTNKPLNAGLTVGSSTAEKSLVSVYLRFGEEYDNSINCDGTIVVYPNLATSNTFYCYYGAFQYEDFPDYNDSDYLVDYTTAGEKKFLTNRPRGSVSVSYADTYYIDWISLAQPTSGTNLVVELDSGATYSIPTATLSNVRRWRAAVGPYNINRYFNDSIINSSVKYYDVYLFRNGNRLTEKWRINVTAPGTFRTRIGFIGLLGSIEYITFYLRNRQAIQVDRRNYKKFLSPTYAVGDRALTTYATGAKLGGRVSTFVDRNTSTWLWEMWVSPNVWTDRRPEMISWRVFREDSTPTSRMLFWLNEGHDLEVGDTFISIADNKTQYEDYNGQFTVQSVEGPNIIDCGLTFDVYNITNEACGWLVKNQTPQVIPIVISDEFVEIKQKLDKPIQYDLTYQTSVEKITLRN
jgi:hypothetical protein